MGGRKKSGLAATLVRVFAEKGQGVGKPVRSKCGSGLSDQCPPRSVQDVEKVLCNPSGDLSWSRPRPTHPCVHHQFLFPESVLIEKTMSLRSNTFCVLPEVKHVTIGMVMYLDLVENWK